MNFLVFEGYHLTDRHIYIHTESTEIKKHANSRVLKNEIVSASVSKPKTYVFIAVVLRCSWNLLIFIIYATCVAFFFHF